MKRIIILGALVLSTGAYAQVRATGVKVEKEVESMQTSPRPQQSDLKQQSEKLEQESRAKGEQLKNQVNKVGEKGNSAAAKGKSEAKEMVDKAKDKANNGIDKQGMKGKEFGQHRAAEAKAKAAAVKTKDDADAMIRMSKEDTKESVKSIDTKMTSARKTLMDKLAAKELTQAQFDEKMTKLKEFEQRKNAIVKEME